MFSDRGIKAAYASTAFVVTSLVARLLEAQRRYPVRCVGGNSHCPHRRPTTVPAGDISACSAARAALSAAAASACTRWVAVIQARSSRMTRCGEPALGCIRARPS